MVAGSTDGRGGWGHHAVAVGESGAGGGHARGVPAGENRGGLTLQGWVGLRGGGETGELGPGGFDLRLGEKEAGEGSDERRTDGRGIWWAKEGEESGIEGLAMGGGVGDGGQEVGELVGGQVVAVEEVEDGGGEVRVGVETEGEEGLDDAGADGGGGVGGG